jgi:ribosome-associated protein
VAARSISSRGGGARQRQYIGKLMREIDLTRVREALGAKAAKAALEAQRFQRAELWRARLLAGGPEALAALRAAYPTLDEAQWLKRVAAARSEREHTGGGGVASRELFRALRELLD